MIIEQIYEHQIKEKAVRNNLEALPDCFAIEEAREHYITKSAE